MKKEQFLALLSKQLSKELSAEENDALLAAIQANGEYQQIAAKLAHYFKQSKTKNVKTARLRSAKERIAIAEKNGFQPTFDYSSPKSNYFSIRNLLKIAAALLLGFLSLFMLAEFFEDDAMVMQRYASTNQKSFFLLEDGTKVWLNKYSSINYNQPFGRDKREITLLGEAYFDVANNTNVPLFIHVANIDIEVKGTAFNVNASRGNSSIEVALERGLIQVTNRLDRGNQVLLKPNQKLMISNVIEDGKSAKFTIFPILASSLQNETKWTVDTLIFNKEKLKDLVLQLEKKYAVKIEIRSAKLGEKRFSGTFTSETIREILDALKLSYPMTYTITNKLVTITD